MNTEIKRISDLLMDTADGNNWTGINAQQALHDISAAKAVRRVNHHHLNIAELVAHLTCWNKVMMARLDKQNYQPGEKEDFPVISRLSAEKWENMKLEFIRSFHLLIGKLENKEGKILNEPMFEGASVTWRNLYGQISHLHYHLGQIVLLKKIL